MKTAAQNRKHGKSRVLGKHRTINASDRNGHTTHVALCIVTYHRKEHLALSGCGTVLFLVLLVF